MFRALLKELPRQPLRRFSLPALQTFARNPPSVYAKRLFFWSFRLFSPFQSGERRRRRNDEGWLRRSFLFRLPSKIPEKEEKNSSASVSFLQHSRPRVRCTRERETGRGKYALAPNINAFPRLAD